MSFHRYVSIRCDAATCQESYDDPTVGTARDLRVKAYHFGWSCAHPYGQDYCPKHATELGTGYQYWDHILANAARNKQQEQT